jgi:hypothetical protein
MSGWRKSSASHANGNCLEAGEDWRKAGSSVNNGACAEVATAPGGVLVRDTTDRSGPFLAFPAGAWRAFLAGITGGGS